MQRECSAESIRVQPFSAHFRKLLTASFLTLTSHDDMLARHSYSPECVCVCLSQVGVLSKRMDGPRLICRSSTYTTQCTAFLCPPPQGSIQRCCDPSVRPSVPTDPAACLAGRTAPRPAGHAAPRPGQRRSAAIGRGRIVSPRINLMF